MNEITNNSEFNKNENIYIESHSKYFT